MHRTSESRAKRVFPCPVTRDVRLTMNETRIAKARRHFSQQRKVRPWLMLLAIIQFVAAGVFGRLFYRTASKMVEISITDLASAEGPLRMNAVHTVALIGWAVGAAILAVAAVHSLVEGLIENPRDVLLAHLLEKTKEEGHD